MTINDTSYDITELKKTRSRNIHLRTHKTVGSIWSSSEGGLSASAPLWQEGEPKPRQVGGAPGPTWHSPCWGDGWLVALLGTLPAAPGQPPLPSSPGALAPSHSATLVVRACGAATRGRPRQQAMVGGPGGLVYPGHWARHPVPVVLGVRPGAVVHCRATQGHLGQMCGLGELW